MNGCSGMTDIVWQHVNVPEASQTTSEAADASHALGHALQSLSLVGCKSLRCCYLGVVPEPSVDLLSLSQHLQQPISWMPARCHLSGTTVCWASCTIKGYNGSYCVCCILLNIYVFARFGTSHATAIKLRAKEHGMHSTPASCNRPCRAAS